MMRCLLPPAATPEWDAWSDYSECSVSCDRGVQVRRRRCIDPTTKASRSTLDCYGSDVEFLPCDMGVCPFFSEWAAWSVCEASTTCGQGYKKRERSCQNNGLVGQDRRCMGPAEEKAPCEGLTCQNPVRLSGSEPGQGHLEIFDPKTNAFLPVCGKGFNKKASDVACRQMGYVSAARVSSGDSSAKDYLISDVVCRGNEESILACQHTSTESTDTCAEGQVKVECVVDGGWGEWSEYGACSVSCANGIRTRQRQCNFPAPKNGGKQCEGDSSETIPCEEKPCPVDGVYKAWGEWSICNKVCGGGEKTRKRECVEPQHGGQPCKGVSSETKDCNEEPCPIDGQWNPWSAWSECSKPCGGGTKTSTRSCTEVKNGGRACVGDTEKTETCNDTPCPVNGVWKKWAEWTECTKTCGGGIRERERECDGPFFGGEECQGEPKEEEVCSTGQCPIDGVFLAWSSWGECTKPCGGGEQERRRQCEGPFFGGNDCDGDREEVRKCNTFQCPIDGIWSEWSKWTECSKTCAGGFTEKIRKCKGPFYGGRDCEGDNIVSKKCNQTPCPINGYWKPWGPWEECSATCGGGEKKRSRDCQGPQYGGDDCSGSPVQTESCKTSPCPIDGVWGDWSAWGECVNGEQFSTRDCSGAQFGGLDCEGDREKKQSC